jgi:hypothetical protein
MKVFPDLNEHMEMIQNQEPVPDASSVMIYQDIARLITHTQWFCMNQGGYNWMFKDTAWCNMTVQITPSKRMQWTDRGVRASEIVDILTGGVDNVPRLETSRLPEGMTCNKDFVERTFVLGDNSLLHPWGTAPNWIDEKEMNGFLDRTEEGYIWYEDPYEFGYSTGNTGSTLRSIQTRLGLLLERTQRPSVGHSTGCPGRTSRKHLEWSAGCWSSITSTSELSTELIRDVL